MCACFRLANDADPTGTLAALGAVERAVVVGALQRGLGPAWAELPAASWVGREVLVPGRVLYDEPAQMGMDRRVACHAAFMRFGASLVVDCGTCVTLTHVDDSETVRGLAIGIGRASMRRGLATAAPALAPFVGAALPAEIPAGTADNLAVGLEQGWFAMVSGLVSTAQRRLQENGVAPGTLVFTGGDGQVAHEACGNGVHAPSLVHEGLWRLTCHAPGC